VIRRIAVPAVLAVALLGATPALAAKKEVQRLAIQVAALQGQLAQIQRDVEESRIELRRLAELVAEQNALLGRGLTERRQEDEAVTLGLRELAERVAVLGETLESLRLRGLPPPGEIPPGADDAATGSADATGAQGPAAAVPAPRELYSQAYADFARGNYDLAIQGFSEYIRSYPDTDFTDNAQYWIGECLYGKKMFAEAVEAWNTLFKDYTTSDKIPDGRVKKGMALERLGRKSQALVEYRYVVDRHPNSQAARIARERLTP
jgi:tol-pal system protein YbgF